MLDRVPGMYGSGRPEMATSIDALLMQVTSWATSRPEIRAVVLVGSQAKRNARDDSDVDLVLLSERPADLLCDRTWTSLFGVVAREATEDWGRLTSVRVWYDDGLEVEFGVTATDWASTADEGTLRVLHDGFRVLLDRDALFDPFSRVGRV